MEKTKRKFKGVWIPREVWLDESLSLTEKALLTEIDSLDNENGCFAGNKYFAEFFKLGERMIKIHIKSLVEKGKVELEMIGRNKRILRVINFPQPDMPRGKETSLTEGKKLPSAEGKKLPHNNTSNNPDSNTADPSESATPLGMDDYIQKMLEDRSEHVQVIGVYADELWEAGRLQKWQTTEQAREFVRKNLKIASSLKVYGVAAVRDVIRQMLKTKIKGTPMEFTLHTVARHIDDPKYNGAH